MEQQNNEDLNIFSKSKYNPYSGKATYIDENDLKDQMSKRKLHFNVEFTIYKIVLFRKKLPDLSKFDIITS